MSALLKWGHPLDYLGMQQQDQSNDFALATSVKYSVHRFVDFAAQDLGIALARSGTGAEAINAMSALIGQDAKCK